MDNLNQDKNMFEEEVRELRFCEKLKERIFHEELRDSQDRIFQRDFARICILLLLEECKVKCNY